MVFSSVPLFLDPHNWHQSPNGETQRTAQAMPDVAVAAAATSSMTERARVAKIPAAEGPLKCPRCDSSNTKFCYFNNYSLTQPRHFCKTCRRYWTRGGSLRNVPVGGGCRRNKRKRSSARRPRSPTAANPAQQPPHPALAELMALPPPPPTTQPFSFMASLHSLMTSQVGMGSFGGNNNNSHYELLPNLLGGGFGASSSSSSSMMYPFQNNNINSHSNNMEGILETASFGKGLLGFPHHLQPPVKMEETAAARVNLLSKQFVTDDVGVSQHQPQLYWSGINSNSNSINHAGLWTDLSGICSSSTTPTLNTIMR